jgi:hypothetical protein
VPFCSSVVSVATVPYCCSGYDLNSKNHGFYGPQEIICNHSSVRISLCCAVLLLLFVAAHGSRRQSGRTRFPSVPRRLADAGCINLDWESTSQGFRRA